MLPIECLLDPLTLGDHLSSTGAGDSLHSLKQPPHKARGGLEAQPRHRIDTMRHPADPCRHHTQQGGLRRIGMDDIRLLLAKQPDQLKESSEVIPYADRSYKMRDKTSRYPPPSP